MIGKIIYYANEGPDIVAARWLGFRADPLNDLQSTDNLFKYNTRLKDSIYIYRF